MVVVALPDAVGAVLAQLRSFSELTALCGSGSPRISAAKQDAWDPMPRTAILVAQAGGPGEWADVDRMNIRIRLTCYGATPLAASALWRMADACFCPSRSSGLSRGFTRASCRVEDVANLTSPFSGIEPETNWPVTTADYMVRHLKGPIS